MIHSASRHALEELRQREHSVFEGSISSDALVDLAGELYSVARLLGANPRLRRALSDASEAADNRTGLVANLFGGKLGEAALGLLTDAVTLRWSSAWDLTDGLEGVADDAVFRAAEKDGDLDRVESELFRLERILDTEGSVVGLLDERSVPPARRVGLLDTLVADKVSPLTLTLLRNAVTSERKRSVALAIDDLLERAAAWQSRSIARVVSAVALSDEQVARVTEKLTEIYGRPITARTAVDPSIKGGLVVRVGDEVIDGSVATRLDTARAALSH